MRRPRQSHALHPRLPSATARPARIPLALLLQLGSLCVQAQTASPAPAALAPDAAQNPHLLAQARPREEPTARVEVTGHYDNAVGTSDAASQGSIRAELLQSRPALRPGEVLEFVPGMVVTQHSGDGKANQYFLRGFNLDHGTDFATSVNGMPVNLPSHAHGQGYTDLNFLLPELVQRIDYRKGPYFARSGDFAAAGAADIAYRSTLDAPFAQLTLGGSGYRRGVMAGSGNAAPGITLLGALELMGNNGPWTVPEGLHRANGVLTASGGTSAQGWQASLMGYQARWTSTDQVPQALIEAGKTNAGGLGGTPFGRYDSLDPTDGGNTARTSLSGEWHRNSASGTTRLQAYAVRYRLQLWSNFTYALDRPATGDQFLQQDRRDVLGLSISHAFSHSLAGLPARSELGGQLRHDRIRVGLFDTRARQTLATTRDDALRETLLGVYGQTTLELAPWLRSTVGLRTDALRTRVDALSLPANSGTARATQWSPKLSLVAAPFSGRYEKTELFFNAGRGLHSNDGRGTTITRDPRTGDPVDKVAALVAARGLELGARAEALPGLQTSVALWQLRSDSELVYVGDAGATQAAAASRRRGVELNNHWAATRWLLLDADLAWTHSRFADGSRIPNAVDRVASVGATVRAAGPWSGNVQWRYLGAGALVEDNSVRSQPSSTVNLRISRSLAPALGRDSALTLDVFNLLDRRVDDIQYFYESRLPGRAAALDRHVHPAEPRTLRLTLRVGF